MQVPGGRGDAAAVLRGVQAGDQAETPPARQMVPGLVRKTKRLLGHKPCRLRLRLHCYCYKALSNGETKQAWRIMAVDRVVWAILMHVPSPRKE